jgi:hypothetical protein
MEIKTWEFLTVKQEISHEAEDRKIVQKAEGD